MVLVDSSVFIRAQRQPNSEEAGELAALLIRGEARIAGPVIMELIQGARLEQNRRFLAERLPAIDCLELDQEAWLTAGMISSRLRRSGEMLPNMDVIIAAAAIRHSMPLYTLDGRFERIPELTFYRPQQRP